MYNKRKGRSEQTQDEDTKRGVEMTDIQPIETRYKGYRFRSRLEARWAVFFDQMGILYEYEPEGFMLHDRAYLPDFRLPELLTYVEIKPIKAFEFSIDNEKHEFSMCGNGIEKYAMACNGFADAGYMYMLLCGDPLDVLLKDHGGNGAGWIFERMQCLIQASKKLDVDIPWEKTECRPEECTECDHYTVMASMPFIGFASASEFLMLPEETGLFPTHWKQFRNAEPDQCLRDFFIKGIQAAQMARSARFEHGASAI